MLLSESEKPADINVRQWHIYPFAGLASWIGLLANSTSWDKMFKCRKKLKSWLRKSFLKR